MKTVEEAVAACLSLPFTESDMPFGEGWTAVRHLENRKIFALVFVREGRTWINVKADPMWGDFWRESFPAVLPAYHMNKRHWVSIVLDGSMSREQIMRLVSDSYGLTKKRRN